MATAATNMSLLHAQHKIAKNDITEIRSNLLKWFAQNARPMPWRLPPVPFSTSPTAVYYHRLYQCLLSETMLQQTQVKTVLAYYAKWLLKFPTFQDLAAATEEEVMACWAGLGYYSRAKRLHQAAQFLVDHFVSKGLEFPHEPEYWIKHVPGVGPYTAGALISQSFNLPAPIVDGNVQRVLSRILAVHGDTSTPKSVGSKVVWECAARLVEGCDEPGELNQSLMELGAVVCTPTLPSCHGCPISTYCGAHHNYTKLKPARPTASKFFARVSTRKGTVADIEDAVTLPHSCPICPVEIKSNVLPANAANYIQAYYPYKPPKKAQRNEAAIVYIIRNPATQQLYLERKEKGLLAGLYDFPTLLLPTVPSSSEEGEEADNTNVLKIVKETSAENKGTTVHLFSHIRRTSHVLLLDRTKAGNQLEEFRLANKTGRWVDAESLGTLGVSELCLKNWRLASGTVEKRGKSGDAAGRVKRLKSRA